MRLPTYVALATCAAAALTVLYWGGQDKQGQFDPARLGPGVGPALFFAGPYLLLAGAAAAGRERAALAAMCFWATLALAAIAVSAMWHDHVTYLRTPPGRERVPVLGFLATLFLWLGSAIVLLTVAAVRIARRSRPSAAPAGRPQKQE